MNAVEELFRQAAAVLDRQDLRWALLGGWAVSLRTEPRFTRDVDLAVAVADDSRAENLVCEFRHEGFEVAALVEQQAVHRLATVRLESRRQDGILLDLLFASSGIEGEICAAAEMLEALPGLTMPVALPEHLLALKLLSRDDQTRPQDAGDIHQLLAIMRPDQIGCVRDALRLITARGYARERDLIAALNQAVAGKDARM